MSDFGSEVGNSGLSLMGKLMEALLKVMAKIFDTVKERTGAEYRLKKAELNSMKDKAAFDKFVAKVEGKTGFVNHRLLEKAGVPLVSTGITLDDAGMKELAARCKREGIVITGVEDIRERELNGNKFFCVECRQSDLPRLAKLIDLMNDEKKIGKIQEEIFKIEEKNRALRAEIAEIDSKVKGLTQDDMTKVTELEAEIEENNLVIDELYQQIEDIRYGYSLELNQEQAQGVVERAVNGETQHGVTFDEAVDRWTGGNLDKDTTSYVVDAKDPNRYIVCTAKNDTFRGQEYVKTTYEVYNGSKQVYATHDGRFEGRPKDYWVREKAAMRDTGGFSDQVIKFYSMKELDAYRANYKEQNATELEGLEVGKEGRNYEEKMKTLEAQLDKCGAVYKDGVVVDKESGKALILTEDMSEADRARVAEAAVIGKQIANYQELAQLEGELAAARAEVMVATVGTAEHTTALAAFEDVDGKYKEALATEASLIDERKGVNAVQAEQETRDDLAAEAERGELEHSDARRDERVAEVEDKQKTMEAYKSEIEARKSADAAKAKDAGDKELAKKVGPKDRGER